MKGVSRTHAKRAGEALLVELPHRLKNLEELEDALLHREGGVLLERLRDQLAQHLGLKHAHIT